ncbi:hypothetical protein [Pseudalkalibacillus caeni]|uniref:Uncharacterized protein n=1 Tax=Exobacillus caeni TaxID=2574798 RepID=A0A5R9FAF2_9BACL|nr:hypothetical protein [Pseudalkalibacillus caeni]TLS39176.1 hypothetical protein FCL54_02365 [Pseudalkalibacillus caeni]
MKQKLLCSPWRHDLIVPCRLRSYKIDLAIYFFESERFVALGYIKAWLKIQMADSSRESAISLILRKKQKIDDAAYKKQAGYYH